MTTGDLIKARRKEIAMSAERLAEKVGVSPATIYRYEKGDIEKVPVDVIKDIAKALNTTPAYLMGWETSPAAPTIPAGFEPRPKTVKRPLVGDIACGEPITAEQNVQEYVDVPEGIVCDFCLRCHGDSMIDAGIRDNDVVYIKTQPQVEDGEIAAVRIGDEATLKRVYYDGSTITLVPANSAYRPKSYSGPELDDIQIEGKATGYTHWF
jgi:repressor LexA